MLKNLFGILKRGDREEALAQPSPVTPVTPVQLSDASKQSYMSNQHPQMVRQISARGVDAPEAVNTIDPEADDIVIAVMGPTSSGKGTFVRAASGYDTKNIHKLKSFTDQVIGVKFWDQESRRNIVLLDTPGFGDTYRSEHDILRMISDWLASSYHSGKLLSGILYLHRITDSEVAGASLKNLEIFRKLCGRDALDKVYLTVTMWDEVESSVGERRLERLRTEHWKTMIAQGARVARCRSNDDSPKKLLRKIIRSENSNKTDVPYEGTSSHMQEKPQRHGVTHGADPRVETRQGPSSSVQEKPPKYVDIRVAKPTIPYPPVVGEQGPSSNVQEEPLRDTVNHEGILPPQRLNDSQQWASSQSQDTNRKQTLLGREPGEIAPRGSAQAAEERKMKNMKVQEVDNSLASPMGLGETRQSGSLIQREMADLKKDLQGITTGQQLYSQLEALVERQLELLRKIEKERATMGPDILKGRQTEYDGLRVQIDDKLRQMHQLGLPRAMRSFSSSQVPSLYGQEKPSKTDITRNEISAHETRPGRSSFSQEEPQRYYTRAHVSEPPNVNNVGHRAPSSFNIVIFGEAGVGKSSVVNLIADDEVAKTSRDAWGCTLESQQYTFPVAKRTFNIWDTIGLGEPMFCVANYLSAIEKTYALIRQIEAKGGLDLLLFCIPGSGSRITKTMLCNYRLFFEVLCETRIPISAVVTRLEDEPRMEEWWVRNEEYISRSGLKFGGHACITGRREHPKAAEGRAALELLLLSYDHRGRYAMPPASEWFSGFLKRLPVIPRSRDLKSKQKELEQLLYDRCMMDSADAQRLAESLTCPREEDC